jgi:hypothetical protein
MKNSIVTIFLMISIRLWAQSLDEYAVEQCRRLGVPVDVAMAIRAEENQELDIYAIHKNRNGSRDLGLWQLNDRYIWSDFIPRYWDTDDVFQWYNPYHSTYIAIRHIKWLYSHGLNHWQVILAYNCGYWALYTKNVPDSSIEYANRVYSRMRFIRTSRKYTARGFEK